VTPDPTLTARWRGIATASLTGALAISAHAAAGGGLPSGAGVVLVGLVALTLGALATTMRHAGGQPVLLALLATGQLLGHLLLGSAGHQHGALPGHGTVGMTAAHVAAVFLGAALIAMAGRLGTALSRAVRSMLPPRSAPIPAAPTASFDGGDQPMRSLLLIATSMSHRGPPVRLAG
jgi:hypothetical protein